MRHFPNFSRLSVFSLVVSSLAILSCPVWAADAPKACGTPAHHSARQTWQQHFTEANVAHDGHLTLEEAKGGYPEIAKHFDDIDTDHKSYVTENDIQAWRAMRKAAHRLGKAPEDKLRPRSAVQRTYPDVRTIAVTDKQTMPAATEPPALRP
jgi:hypothetical protein